MCVWGGGEQVGGGGGGAVSAAGRGMLHAVRAHACTGTGTAGARPATAPPGPPPQQPQQQRQPAAPGLARSCASFCFTLAPSVILNFMTAPAGTVLLPAAAAAGPLPPAGTATAWCAPCRPASSRPGTTGALACREATAAAVGVVLKRTSTTSGAYSCPGSLGTRLTVCWPGMPPLALPPPLVAPGVAAVAAAARGAATASHPAGTGAERRVRACIWQAPRRPGRRWVLPRPAERRCPRSCRAQAAAPHGTP